MQRGVDFGVIERLARKFCAYSQYYPTLIIRTHVPKLNFTSPRGATVIYHSAILPACGFSCAFLSAP